MLLDVAATCETRTNKGLCGRLTTLIVSMTALDTTSFPGSGWRKPSCASCPSRYILLSKWLAAQKMASQCRIRARVTKLLFCADQSGTHERVWCDDFRQFRPEHRIITCAAPRSTKCTAVAWYTSSTVLHSNSSELRCIVIPSPSNPRMPITLYCGCVARNSVSVRRRRLIRVSHPSTCGWARWHRLISLPIPKVFHAFRGSSRTICIWPRVVVSRV
jgi:hypothetical protein